VVEMEKEAMELIDALHGHPTTEVAGA
jgi:hypothetical protein